MFRFVEATQNRKEILLEKGNGREEVVGVLNVRLITLITHSLAINYCRMSGKCPRDDVSGLGCDYDPRYSRQSNLATTVRYVFVMRRL